MPQPNQVPSALDRILQESLSFYLENRQNPEISRTFGYFTRHPVARLNQKRLRLLTEFLPKPREGHSPVRILDLCCGAGLITNTCALLGHRVAGFDLDSNEIRLAEKFTQRLGLSTPFRAVDLLNDPHWERDAETLLGGKPDFVILAYALHHLPDIHRFLDRLANWAGPGTCVLVNEENPLSPLFRLKHWVRTWLQKDTDVEWHQTYPTWNQWLSERGFQVSAPIGADPIPGLSRVFPSLCWSVLFKAEKTSS